MSKKIVILGLLLVIGCSGYIAYAKTHYNLISQAALQRVRERLIVLTPSEKRDLAVFLDESLSLNQYAYTLMKYKPMSICNYVQWTEDLPIHFKRNYEGVPARKIFYDTLERGCQAWIRYQTLFPPRKFLLSRYPRKQSKGMLEVALIHYDLCKKTIEDHLDDFQEVLQEKYTPDEILAILTEPEHEKFYLLISHDRLLGILLGFGRGNAYLYEHTNLKESLSSFSNELPIWPNQWILPTFACDPTTEETKKLKKMYLEARKFIRWTYFNKDSLEVSLALLDR